MRVQLVATVLAGMALGATAFLQTPGTCVPGVSAAWLGRGLHTYALFSIGPNTTRHTTARLPLTAARAPVRRCNAVQMGVVEAFGAYADLFAPTIRSVVQDFGIPAPLFKWFHGANMVRHAHGFVSLRRIVIIIMWFCWILVCVWMELRWTGSLGSLNSISSCDSFLYLADLQSRASC